MGKQKAGLISYTIWQSYVLKNPFEHLHSFPKVPPGPGSSFLSLLPLSPSWPLKPPLLLWIILPWQLAFKACAAIQKLHTFFWVQTKWQLTVVNEQGQCHIWQRYAYERENGSYVHGCTHTGMRAHTHKHWCSVTERQVLLQTWVSLLAISLWLK